MIQEFKKFAMKGNVIDMAVGIIIGTAFGKIITSLVNDIIMPPIGVLLGKVDFSNLALTLQQKSADHALVQIQYGSFINTIINFLIIAWSIFIVVSQLDRFKNRKEPEATTQSCHYCQSSISIKATRCPACTSQLSTNEQQT